MCALKGEGKEGRSRRGRENIVWVFLLFHSELYHEIPDLTWKLIEGPVFLFLNCVDKDGGKEGRTTKREGR